VKTYLLLIILICTALVPVTYPREIKLLQGINLIDGRGNFFPDVDILIEGDVITGIGPAGSVRAPDSAEIFDLNGKFVIPGPGQEEQEEMVYIKTIREDFTRHLHNVSLVYDIGMSIVQRIDSLFSGQRTDTANMDLIRGIMVTRQYDRTILAYKDILNSSYIADPVLKLQIARHVALFEGYSKAKREWDNQWDITARPFIYKHGLFSQPGMFGFQEGEKRYNLYHDPEFRTILWDRRMFAWDLTYTTPALLESANAIIARIDELTGGGQ
jgi:hypothetical protein